MTAILKLQEFRAREQTETSLEWSHDRTFSGYVFDAANTAQKFVVELLIDGYSVKCVHAVDYVSDLAAGGIGDGCYGFTFSLADDAMQGAEVIEARVANLGTAIGEPIVIREAASADDASPDASAPGAIRWLGGTQFSGWIAEGNEATVDIFVDDEKVDQVQASGWSHVGSVEDARAVRAFDCSLPIRYADGSARRLAAMNSRGEHLEGSPLSFACSDGRTQPGEWADPVSRMSVPFGQYQRWREQLPHRPASGAGLKAAVIVVGSGGIDTTSQSLDRQSHLHWVAASLPEGDGFAGFDNEAARTFLAEDAAEAEFVTFLLSGARLNETALARISEAFAGNEHAVAVYGDVDIGEAEARWPLAFPAFDYERMLEQGYCGHVFALRRSVAERAIAAGAANLYRVFNSILDDGSRSLESIVHLPGAMAVLPAIDLEAAARALAAATQAHLTQRGVSATVAPGSGQVLPAVEVVRKIDESHISIVIPARNRREPLEACIASLEPTTRKHRCEIIVVDNDSSDPDMLGYLSSIDGRQATVVRVAGDHNPARLNNLAAARASGDYLCLLSNEVRALDDRWLDEMLGRISSADVGAVGALLSRPSGVVQHGGIVLGPDFGPAAAFNDRIDGDNGYGDLLRVAHQCSAVTAACMLTRWKDYLDLAGMDEFGFPVHFGDIDYCLKLRAAGKRIVMTPHAKLLRSESAVRMKDQQANRKVRFERELRNLRSKWADVLAADPFYNPALSLDPIPFSALAWPPRSMAARMSSPPVPVNVPPGF